MGDTTYISASGSVRRLRTASKQSMVDYVLYKNEIKHGGRGETISLPTFPTESEIDALRDATGMSANHNEAQKYFDDYQGSGYVPINKALWNQEDTSKLPANIKDKVTKMQSYMKPIGKDMTLYRYQPMTTLMNAGFDPNNPQAVVGQYMHMKGLMSFAYDPDKPSSFQGNPNFVVMKTPKWAKGYAMQDHDWEGEFLMDRNIMAQITSVKKVGKYWVTYVEMKAQKG